MRRLAALVVGGVVVVGLTGSASAAQADRTWQHGAELWGSKGGITWTGRTVRITGTGWDRSIGASTLVTFEGLSGRGDANVDTKTRHVPEGDQPFNLVLGRTAQRPVDAVRVTTFQRGVGMAYSYTILRRP